MSDKKLTKKIALKIRHELQVHPIHTSNSVLDEVIGEIIALVREDCRNKAIDAVKSVEEYWSIDKVTEAITEALK